MASFSKTFGFSAWNKHVFVDSDPSIGIREASISKHTEELVFSLFECRQVEVQEAVVFVAVSQHVSGVCRRRVYTVGLRIKGDSLIIGEGDGVITVQPRLMGLLENFQYVRHEGGLVLRGDRAPVDALFDDDRSVTSVERYFRSSVDGGIVSRSVVECVPFHSFMKGEVGCSGAESVDGSGSGRKRRMHDDEDHAAKKCRFEMPVSFRVQYGWKYVYYY